MELKKKIRYIIPGNVLDVVKKTLYYNESSILIKQYKDFLKEYSYCSVEDIKLSILEYVNSLRGEGFEYFFSKSADAPSLYASVFACLIRGSFGDISESDKLEWAKYINSFQNSEGLYIDSRIQDRMFVDNREGYCARHLLGHITAALDLLSAKPIYEFHFLKNELSLEQINEWYHSLNFHQIWSSSNQIMNYGIALQYSRDRLNLPYNSQIEYLEELLLKSNRLDCGMWYDGKLRGKSSLYEVIRGAYHIVPIMYYDQVSLPYPEVALNILLKSQNQWGGFDLLIGSGACEDIDAIDTLLRLAIQTDYPREKIMPLLNLSKKWILFNQNQDGGFVYNRKNTFCWGKQPALYSKKNESNLFATWFRTLSMQLIDNYCFRNNNYRVKTPGMECPLYL